MVLLSTHGSPSVNTRANEYGVYSTGPLKAFSDVKEQAVWCRFRRNNGTGRGTEDETHPWS